LPPWQIPHHLPPRIELTQQTKWRKTKFNKRNSLILKYIYRYTVFHASYEAIFRGRLYKNVVSASNCS
jgi:hypothetical protein